MLKIEIVYKDSKGNIVKKEDLKKERSSKNYSIPRQSKIIDNSGFSYKTRKSKNSEVKYSFLEKSVEDNTSKFISSENSQNIKLENEKYSVTYNKINGKCEFYQKIHPTLVKNFLKDQKRIIKTVELSEKDIRDAATDESLFEILVETA